jgi:5,10-methylenetetrahydrofolate reductase
MQYFFKPENFERWSELATEKIHVTIELCTNLRQLESAKKMIDTFIMITALEDNIETEELEWIVNLYWLKIILKKHKLFETKLKQ